MSSKRDQKKINFDNYADNYKDYIAESLGNLEDNLNYYHIKKCEILKKELGFQPKKILDLGCGVGTMLELLITFRLMKKSSFAKRFLDGI